MTTLWIGLAGALGSASRHWVGQLVARGGSGRIPVGTLSVNVLGSLVFGLVIAFFASRAQLDSKLRIAISVGFLGGFTTYSSFAYETVTFLEKKDLAGAASYVGLTLLCAGSACAAGLWAGRRLFGVTLGG